MALLENYVKLENGVPVLLHFTGWTLMPKNITDPSTGSVRKVNSIHLSVDEENGRPVTKELSVVSEKLAAQLEPYLENGTFVNKKFKITKTGIGFNTGYSVEVL